MKQSIIYQRVESWSIFLASLYMYWFLDFNLLIFGLLLFVFDIFMLGYLFNPKVGAYLYNLGHSMVLPPVFFVIGYASDARLLVGFSLIWFAHIGFDRGLGYGLKFTSSFKDTHLGHIGKK